MDALKGTKFVKVPKLMNIIINRFTFDLVYMRRVKLDDLFSFPFILNMNDYINGYEGIKNKVSEESTPEYFNEITRPKPKTTAAKKPATTTKQGVKTVGGKPVKPTIRSYINDMKKNPVLKDDFVIYSKDMENPPPLMENNPIVEQYGAISNNTDNNDVTAASTSGSNSQVASRGDVDDTNSKSRKVAAPFDMEVTVENDHLGMSPSKKIKKNTDTSTVGTEMTEKSKPVSTKMDVESNSKEESKEDAEALKEKEEEQRKLKEERDQKIRDYLQDGPLVYELYSILVHSGGAYGGHYYAYIKSFEDGKWYTFNDTTVSEVDQKELPSKTFGGGKSANAYMLIYRQVESEQEEKFSLDEKAIPAYLKKFIDEETKKYRVAEQQRMEKAKNTNIRVYHQLKMSYIPAHFDESYKAFEDKAINEFRLNEKRENVRLRAYQAHTDSKLETYTNKEDKTLSELKITGNKVFIIEIKRDDEQFEDYDADTIHFKVAQWRENLPDLTEDTLKPEKIGVNKEGTLKDLIQGVASKFNIPVDQVRLIKKTSKGGFPVAELLNVPENMNEKYIDLRIYEGNILFVEKVENDTEPLLWKEEFDRDAYNYKIKFNTPKFENFEIMIDYNHHIMIDSRKSLKELKTEICKTLNADEKEILIRKGGKLGNEIKDLRQTILSANFVNGSSVFVEFGKPTVIGEMRIFVSLALKRAEEDDALSHNFEELFELIINGDNTASEVKELIAKELETAKGIKWDPKNMRLRERIGMRLAKVLRDSPLKQQGVSDKKTVSIELLDEPDTLNPKDYLVVCRVWNSETLDLGPRFEVVVDRTQNVKHLAEKICAKDQTVKV